MQMRMGVWLRTDTRFLGTHLCFTGELFPGVLNGRRSSHFPPRKVRTLPLLMQQRRASGLGPSFPNSFLASSTPPPFFPITSQLLPSPKTISTMPARNISTSVSTLFITLLKTVLFDLSTAQPTTWSPIHSPKLFLLQKSNILHRNSDLPHLEGECWNSKVQHPHMFHPFPVYLSPPFLWINSLPTIYSFYPFLYSLPTCDIFTACVLMPVVTP